MHALSASQLLDVWEQGLIQTPVERALTMLRAAFPNESLHELAQRSIGQRNDLLLTLRERIFGSQFEAMATCPDCGEQLELNFDTADIRAAPQDVLNEPFSLDVSGYKVHFRLPNSTDLVIVLGYGDPVAVRQVLLERCLLSVSQDGEEKAIETLPAGILHMVTERMDQADPQANIQLSLTCPACAHQWQAIFDILPYFWSEFDAWAHRTLRDVHRLASAYGWSEPEILNMKPWRRQVYLEMMGR